MFSFTYIYIYIYIYIYVYIMHGTMKLKKIKSVLWRVTKRLSYIQDTLCLKVNMQAVHIQRILTVLIHGPVWDSSASFSK